MKTGKPIRSNDQVPNLAYLRALVWTYIPRKRDSEGWTYQYESYTSGTGVSLSPENYQLFTYPLAWPSHCVSCKRNMEMTTL